MPRGPKGQKRPRDTNQLVKLMVDIQTGEVEDLQEGRKSRLRCCAPHDVLQLRQAAFETARHAGDGGRREREALGGFGYCGALGSRRAQGRETWFVSQAERTRGLKWSSHQQAKLTYS